MHLRSPEGGKSKFSGTRLSSSNLESGFGRLGGKEGSTQAEHVGCGFATKTRWRLSTDPLDEDNLLTLFEPLFALLLPLARVPFIHLRLQTFLLESLRVLLCLLRSRLRGGIIFCIWTLPDLIQQGWKNIVYAISQCISFRCTLALRVLPVVQDSD